MVAKGDLKQLFQYNRFLGDQYNDSLTIKDQIAPHATVDRMLAARFEVKNAGSGSREGHSCEHSGYGRPAV